MPFTLVAGRRRLLRWLVVPLAAAAVTTVQVVQDAPGPLRAEPAGAAPQFPEVRRVARGPDVHGHLAAGGPRAGPPAAPSRSAAGTTFGVDIGPGLS